MVEFSFISVGFVAVFLLQTLASACLELLNSAHLVSLRANVPPPLRDVVDADKLVRMSQYSLDNSRLFLIGKISQDAIICGFIVSGMLTRWAQWFYTQGPGYVAAGVFFFLAVGVALLVLGLPFNYYRTFVIEEKYGFNRSDLRTWALDQVKGALLSAGVLVVVLAPLLWTVEQLPGSWWFWGFVIVSLFELVLIVLYPVLIAPIFNKFEPLADEALAAQVTSLINRAGMKPREVFQMDAGRRSAHSNAYFTGLGKTRRIVLFDTLISSHTHEEILAVLAHEIGHSRLRHIVKFQALSLVFTLAGFYATFLLMNWEMLYSTFHLNHSESYAVLLIVGIFWQRIGYFAHPLLAGLSRSFERAADMYAVHLTGSGRPLAEALKKMAVLNLANLNPHPFYVWFNYSHPPIPERIELLAGKGNM